MARKILRYPLDERTYEGGEVATVKVGANPVVRHVGPGTSPRINAWVEVDVEPDGLDAPTVELRFAFVPTGDEVPAGEYRAMVREQGPMGSAIRHVIQLPF